MSDTFRISMSSTQQLLLACRTGDLSSVRELLAAADELSVDVHANREQAFRSACAQGHVQVVHELLTLTGDAAVDVHALNENALLGACRKGHLYVVRELLALTGDRIVDVHASSEEAFRSACANGHVDIVCELLNLVGDRAVDVHARAEAAFRAACFNGQLGVVRVLLGLKGDRTVDVHAFNEDALQAACIGPHLHVLRELLGVPSFTWDTPQQQVALADCLAMGLLEEPQLVTILLAHAPLPVQWLSTVFGSQRCMIRSPVDVPAAQAAAAQCWQLLQQVLLAAAAGVEEDSTSSVRLPAGVWDPFVCALVLCCVLPGGDFARLRQALTAGADTPEGGKVGIHTVMGTCGADFAWCDVAVPLTPNAPGADIARAQLGALSRPGRRAMVLRRAAGSC